MKRLSGRKYMNLKTLSILKSKIRKKLKSIKRSRELWTWLSNLIFSSKIVP